MRCQIFASSELADAKEWENRTRLNSRHTPDFLFVPHTPYAFGRELLD